MRARSARAAYNKRHMSMSPEITDPSHRSRHVSPDALSPRSRRRSNTTSPLAEPRQRHNSEEIYHEPSDPDTMSMRTTNTNDFNRQPEGTRNGTSTAAASPPGAAMDSGDEEGGGRTSRNKSLKPYDNRIVEADTGTTGPPKSKITYAKWSKEIPLDPFTTERVTAEKYTIEGDGATIDLPPDWKRYWIKGNLRRQAVAANGAVGVAPDIAGMVPPGDHHVPMHPHPQSMPMPGPGAPHFRPPPAAFRHPPPTGPGPMPDGAPMMMPPYGAPPPLPPRPPFGLPRAAGAAAYRGQPQPHFRKTAAWMY